MTTELTAENVELVLRDSLFSDAELEGLDLDGYSVEQILEMEDPPFLAAVGIVRQYAYHTERLRSHTAEIRDMLLQLPDNFKESSGGGWSFLQAAERADGRQWGEHRSIETLLCMGCALGYARWLLPKEMWSVLPGGVPYVVVLDGQFETAT